MTNIINARELFRKFIIKHQNHWLSERIRRSWIIKTGQVDSEIDEEELIDFVIWETSLSREDIIDVLDSEFLFLKNKGVIK